MRDRLHTIPDHLKLEKIDLKGRGPLARDMN